MINTLLEHVPIKMEVQEIEENNGMPVHPPQHDGAAQDVDETDDEVVTEGSEVEDDDDEDDVDEEEESDIETDALEIEKEATMLISSDEEAELEAQRIRFPDISITKKLRRDSNISLASSSRSSQTSSFCSQPHITYEIVKQKDCTMEGADNKQRNSPRLKHMENKTLESHNKENNSSNNKSMLKQKTENKNLESSNKILEGSKTKSEEANKNLDNQKNSENNRKKENCLKSPPVNAGEQKSRRGSSNSTCSVASTVASDGAETESCGNIYVFNLEQKLIFNCEFCDLKYGDLDNFGLHLHEAHKLFNIDEDPEKENAPRNLGKNTRQAKSVAKNCVSVKKEPLQCPELKAEPPIALPPSALAEPLDSCGNVFMLNHRKLFLVCGYCESKYANLEVFEKHLRQQHRIFEGCHNEVNVVPKVEVKEEVLAVAEIVNTSDIIIPQAMVAIPAEIPLNITPENEQQIVAASENAAIAQEPTVQKKDIAREETTIVPETVDPKENSASQEILVENEATAMKVTADHCAKHDKEQKSMKNITQELAIAKVKASGEEVSVNAAETETKQKLKNENKVATVKQKSSNKRSSCSDKQSESLSKRSKKKTRNNKRHEQKSPALPETDIRPSAKALETVPIVEKESSTKLTQTVETPDNNPSTISRQTLKETAAEIATQENTYESKECLKAENDTAVKKSPTRELIKIPELEQNTPVMLTDTGETEEATGIEIVPVKLTKVVETRKTAEPEKKTCVTLTKTRETRKRKDADAPADNKFAETKKAVKSREAEKTKHLMLPELAGAGKAKQFDKITLAEAEPKKTTTLKSKIPRGPKKTRCHEKATSLKNAAKMRETRTTTKRNAGDCTTTEVVELKKPLPSSAEKNKSSLSIESKNLEDKKKFETKKYQCSICYKEFTRRRTLILHESTAHPAGFRKIYGCGICNQGFLDEHERKSHMFQRHNAHIYFDCNLCYRAYSAKGDLERHNEEVHEVKIYKCGECLRTYSSERSLKAHLYTYHNAAMKRAIAKNRKTNSGQKLILTTTIQKEPLPVAAVVAQLDTDVKDEVKLNLATTMPKESMQAAAAAQLENNVKNDDVNGKTASVVVAAAVPTASSTMIYALDNINTKPIDIIDVQLSNVQLANLTEITDTYGLNSTSNSTEQIIYVSDLNGEPANREMVVEIATENTALKALPIESEDTTKSLASTAVAFGAEYERDDRTADPVNDIIAQLQNELSESTSSETSNMVTYTINALPNTDETQKAAALDSAQLSAVDKTEDVKPTFLKIIKHFVCDVCPKTYSKHSRLIEHKRLHTGEKPFNCDECGKHFRTRNRLNEHKQRHSKERNFKCEICLLSFVTRNDFTLHMRHHNNDRRHKCPVCGKAFVRSSDLKIHERIHTGEKPYVCDVCNKSFRANQNLSVHKKSHMGDVSKTFQCEHCDKKFMRKIDRKVHMRTHTGERPFKCEICQRAYSSRVNVRAHIDRDHVKGGNEEKKKPGPKTRSLIAELERQKKLIEELQSQLLQQVKKDEKETISDEEMQPEHILPDSHIKVSSPIAIPPNSATRNDIVQSAFNLMVDKLKASSSSTAAASPTTTSKSLTVIPSPPLLDEPSSPSSPPPPPPLTPNAKTDSTTTLLPLTITQTVEPASPAAASTLCLASPPPPPLTSSADATATATATSCLVKHSRQPTPTSPPAAAAAAKTTSAKVVSQKTSLGGIQQVSVTVSMQVENVAANPNTAEKDNAQSLSTSPSDSASSVKKERKITSYFTVLDQKSKG